MVDQFHELTQSLKRELLVDNIARLREHKFDMGKFLEMLGFTNEHLK